MSKPVTSISATIATLYAATSVLRSFRREVPAAKEAGCITIYIAKGEAVYVRKEK